MPEAFLYKGIYRKEICADFNFHFCKNCDFLATCKCDNGKISFFKSVIEAIPEFSLSNNAFYLNNAIMHPECQQLCACDDEGNCYKPYGVFEYHAMSYCNGNFLKIILKMTPIILFRYWKYEYLLIYLNDNSKK